MSTVLAVANQKGGVAKTTSVGSLGAALAEQGARVRLVDLDPLACLTFSHRALRDLATFVLGRCNGRVLGRMRKVLGVGHEPHPFGTTRAEKKEPEVDG